MPCPPIPQPDSDDAIDELMINDALATTGGGAWPDAETLDLSFRRLAKIENLVCFDRLTSLSLSNNRIAQIEGVSHIATLTSLDLSFNKIEVVPEELKQLANLRELSLHSNGLSDLSTIDTLQKLKVLNVGSNRIEKLESFLPLRKLTELRALVASDNPCSEKFVEDYEAYVLAYLGNCVRWLDYRVVDAEKVAACREQFQNELEALGSSEAVKKAEADLAERDLQNNAALRKVFMFEAVTLYEALVIQDEHLGKLERMDGLSDICDSLKADLEEVVEALRVEMLKRCGAVEADEAEFRERLEAVYDSSQAESVAVVKSLKRNRKQLYTKDLACSLPPRVEFVGSTVPDLNVVDKKVRAIKAEIGSAKENLEALEAKTQSASLQLIDSFEDNYSAAMLSLVELLQEAFQKCMNAANKFYDQLKDLAVSTVAEKGGQEAGAPPADPDDEQEAPQDEYLLLIGNLDHMMEVVNACHERHESLILSRDEAVRKSVRETIAATLQKCKAREFNRSRTVVKDVLESCTELSSSVDLAYDVVRAQADTD